MFNNKSLNSILGTFNKVSTDLTNFIERTSAEHDMHNERIQWHEEQADAKMFEINRAEAVKEKIAQLIA